MEQDKNFDVEARLTRLEVLMEEMIKKQDDFNENYKELPKQITILQEENKNQQKEIDELNGRFKGLTGAMVAIATALIIALVKNILGI